MKEYLVKTYLASRGRAGAEYLGLQEREKQPVKVSYAKAGCIIVPSWFETETAALDYCDKVQQGGMRLYWLVQEFRYSDGRTDKAKMVIRMADDAYPVSHDGETVNEINGKEYITHVRTLWFCDRDVAVRYVDNFNKEIQIALSERIAS